ncbi:MAG: hypothetical protein KIT84_02595 [Labilithrix sp.]|nr:hypothetical protein [Labilithrix sp.]MCW5809869.1 hypothetical protein [Labilithrix sp.]
MSSPDDAPMSGPMPPRRPGLLQRIAGIGASAQAAIPGLYAWAITVAPAAWSRGAPLLAKAAAIMGIVALVTAPFVEGSGGATAGASDHDRSAAKLGALERVAAWTGPMWARTWSVWGFVLSSAMVWALAPSALSSARMDGVRGAAGMVGWALFAFASAGPALKPDPSSPARIIASTSLKPRSALPRGDGAYVAVGVVLALAMQGVGWGVAVPERAVLVRLVTVVCGIAVIGGTTSIALARHGTRIAASRRIRLRRALPWLVLLGVVACAGVALGVAR